MKKKLIYLTSGFPGDMYSEKVFAESQLDSLQRAYDHILIVPLDRVGESRGYEAGLSENITTDRTLADDPVIHSRLRRLPYIFHPFVIRSLWEMIGEARSLRDWGKGLFQAINTVRIASVLKKITTAHGLTPADTDIFSLWFYDSAAGAALMAKNTGWKVFTSAHSADLYDCTRIFRSRSLRNRLLYSIEKVYPISEHGLKYLKGRYPEHTARFELRRLGSRRLFAPSLQAVGQSPGRHLQTVSQSPGRHLQAVGQSSGRHQSSFLQTIRFCTVARLVPLKRVDLAIEIITELAHRLSEIKFEYTIIGDGECLESLREKAKTAESAKNAESAISKREPSPESNLQITFLGSLENEEIQRIYATNPPDWFLLTSSTEGVPVSIGEALSYGIPVIATDVGQVAELATPDCSVLLPGNASAKEMAEAILPVMTDSKRHNEMAIAAIARWESNFRI